MKYISSHGEPFLGKRFDIIAESEEEAKALKIVQEVIGMMPHFCGLATLGHQPYFHLCATGYDGKLSDSKKNRPSSLEFGVVTLSHAEAEKQEMARSEIDKHYFLTSEERSKETEGYQPWNNSRKVNLEDL